MVLSNNELEVLSEGILDGLLNLQQVSFQNNKVGSFSILFHFFCNTFSAREYRNTIDQLIQLLNVG